MTDTITLSADEVHAAASHALLRRTRKIEIGRKEKSHQQRSPWDDEIEAACAEMAFCKSRGFYWTGAGNIRAPDGGGFEVRWTKYEGAGGMIVYADTPDDTAVVLLDGFAPRYRVVGWAWAGDCKRAAWRQSYGFLVPRLELLVLSALEAA